ncbi:cytochrome c oxidase accessory protein CcoG [Gilvimarinus sp. SDUM040013]|uniref:Cytochrome c oxidase accessory protein CcoG n=1 Tax=Gilvimarinus gilvus TaxID=3058038 RepID=A0ABU4RUQ8_9GAMM|nr:cytochrome c oxidase accessory protein CcoG [Gilvimarinus sp. SDUM040013]MDO3387104.1 cytochrome c oxidase accessory protein CcoG [Gilvimarinus sp. SDUM040013]MDX6848001.1 cytochrome c oxidase accessory protein CcoG [Gilvimarinus sp. SDUM040013]
MSQGNPHKSPKDDHVGEDGVRYINLYEADDKVYTRRITGFYQKLRRYTGLPLIAGFALLPWLLIDGRPAVLFDLPERKFHILWTTFWPHDGMYLAWLLIISAFLLFTVTVLVGRVWCGFTCPQTVWTQMYIFVEYLCQGDRNKRIKLDAAPWSVSKLLRKGSTFGLWLLIALVTALTFVGYFVPIRDLIGGLLSLDIHPAAAFWVFFFTAATFINAGFLRQQVCKYMCPYARFQSVMYDPDTLTVFYDYVRGEKRGPRKPGDDYKAEGLGDCIDCSWCVQVCPVDIDIRDGLQSECIDCGLCVDACNTVMDKMDYPRGLIRFTTEDSIKHGKAHVLRPRFVGYLMVLLVMISVFVYNLSTRTPLGMEVLRDRGVRMYRISGKDVQNVYTLKINNMDGEPHRYTVEVAGDYPFRVQGYKALEVESGEVFTFPMRVAVERKALKDVETSVTFTVTAIDNDALTTQHTTSFIGPQLRDY